MPCRRLSNIDSLVASGTDCAEMIERVMIGAKNEIAFRPKHHFSPSRASVIPPNAGPTVTARLNWIEFKAIAFGISSRSTRVGMSDRYAGPPKACANPERNDRHRMGQTRLSPKATRTVRVAALAI